MKNYGICAFIGFNYGVELFLGLFVVKTLYWHWLDFHLLRNLDFMFEFWRYVEEIELGDRVVFAVGYF